MRSAFRLPILCLAAWSFAICQSAASAQGITPLPAAESRQDLPPADSQRSATANEAVIPGPLRSFLRMAGVSQKATTEEILPLLARNIYVQGYQGWRSDGRPTEFLILVRRYAEQAKELTALAGPSGIIRVENCDQAIPLLRILGYRVRQQCGQKDASLVTADSERAFLTVDSGFPLALLEESLRQGKPFTYDFPISRVPMLLTEDAWTKANRNTRRPDYGLLDAILRDPELARLYWAMSRIDGETRLALQQSIGLRKLLPYASVLDFYGSHICIRSGRVQVPGGASAETEWKELVGAAPDSHEFVLKLVAKDKGWLAAYFDAMARINQEQQRHLIDTHDLKKFYEAFRGKDSSADAARPAFRPAPGLLLLLTRVRWDANGQPLVPGGLVLWKEVLAQKNEAKIVREWGKRAAHWTHPDQLLEAMFAFSRVETDANPLQIYLLFSELEGSRPPKHQLSLDTYRLLSQRFGHFDEQYLTFSEFPDLNDAAISSFVQIADTIDRLSNRTLRGNAMGTFQACVGLWQILARQGQIPPARLSESWQAVITPFSKLSSSADLFDAGRDSLRELLRAATDRRTRVSQDEIIELIAGPRQTDTEGRRLHAEVARRIRAVMDGQRLVSLDTLLALGQGLHEMARGQAVASSLIPLAGELREFEMPRQIFTSSERSEWAAGVYNNRHTELQMQTNLAKVLKSSASRAQLDEARGQLAPFLRDNLVGLNYAYYEPPGAQMLHANPLFVRSHDFSGETVAGIEELWRAPQLFGQGSPAGGGAHLVGSLADLAYVLSEAEQDFIAPENVQALIWRESVPGLLHNAILPRWWNVSRNELHAVALYQRAGEELLSVSVSSDELREKVMHILSDRMLPQRISWLEQSLGSGRIEEVLSRVAPADTFYLAADFRRRFPDDNSAWGAAGQELDSMGRRYPEDLSWERLSRDVGVPHRTLAQSYARELLNVKPFPAFSGYSSRLMAESWDSSNLYWARLADEKGYSPVMLNRLVPELTHRMVEKIFATDFEDWTALLRAMRETGDEFRQGKIATVAASGAAATETSVR